MFFPTRKYTTLLEKFSRPALGTSVQVLAQIGEFPRLFREPGLLHCLLELVQSRLEDVGHSLSNLFWVIAAQGSLYPRWTDTHSQGKCNPRPFFRRPIVFLR